MTALVITGKCKLSLRVVAVADGRDRFRLLAVAEEVQPEMQRDNLLGRFGRPNVQAFKINKSFRGVFELRDTTAIYIYRYSLPIWDHTIGSYSGFYNT